MPRLNVPAGEPFGDVRPRSLQERRRHGGAWKVAYADFVTALLALFIVLWMMNTSRPVRESVSGYFHDPRGYKQNPGTAGSSAQKENVSDIQRQLEQALRKVPEFEKIRANIKFSVTTEGLRIDLMENEQGLFFNTGGCEPTEAGTHLLAALASEVAKMPNSLIIEGHTDARPFRNAAPARGYGNWELSADRANAARRVLHQYGVRTQQVVEVRGFADQRLLVEGDPEDARNRRVSLVVKFTG